MTKENIITELKTVRILFNRSTDCLIEEDSSFKPQGNLYTVAQMVAHVGLSINWFVDGAFGPDGFSMDFEAHIKEALSITSLEVAREVFEKSIENTIAVFENKTDKETNELLPDGPIMGGMPKVAIIGGISEHTAHHRGALTVYSRMLGKIPNMPYM